MSKCFIRCGSLIPKMNSLLNTEKLSDIITYYVKYIGSIEILTSLQNINYQTKGWFIKECIKRVCDKAGIDLYYRTKVLNDEIIKNISDKPNITNSGVIVMMSISSCNITLVKADTGDVIIAYDMPKIVFTAYSNLEAPNYFVIVTSGNKMRICYILETIHDSVKDIIRTITYAFKYQNMCENVYNRIDDQKFSKQCITYSFPIYAPQCISKITVLKSTILNIEENPNNEEELINTEKMVKIHDKYIKNEIWYHDTLNRRRAEKILKCNGDFLVRKSKAQNGAYVLSSMTENIKVHFLLTNCNGAIRTNEYIYDSITHLVRYHYANLIPIYYHGYVLFLKNPIVKK